MGRKVNDMSWYDLACAYVDMKWKTAAATYRRSIAEALVTATIPMFKSDRESRMTSSLGPRCFAGLLTLSGGLTLEQPQEISATLRWIERNTKSVSTLTDKQILRPVLNAIASKLDGKAAAATVVNRKRAVLSNLMEYAVELELLDANPIPNLKWKAPKVTHVVDRRSVVNPVQARTLLNAVGAVRWSGKRLKACYACSYYWLSGRRRQ